MSDIEGQVALVTGASRGIGAAIAGSLASAGAVVIGTATTDKGAEQIGNTLGSSGRGAVLDIAMPGLSVCDGPVHVGKEIRRMMV